MLPLANGPTVGHSQDSQTCVTVSSVQRKKRQTFVFSATIALSPDFRKKLKHGALKPKQPMSDGFNSIESLSERAGMRENVAIIDLTNTSILANKLEESFIEFVPFHLIVHFLFSFCRNESRLPISYIVLYFVAHMLTLYFWSPFSLSFLFPHKKTRFIFEVYQFVLARTPF